MSYKIIKTELLVDNKKAYYSSISGIRTVFLFQGNFTKTRKLFVVNELLDILKYHNRLDSKTEISDKMMKQLLSYGRIEKEISITRRFGEMTMEDGSIVSSQDIDISGFQFFSTNKENKFRIIGIG